MRKQLPGLAVGFFLVVGSVGADGPAGHKDLDKLQGTWTYTSMNVGGNKVPAKDLKHYRIRYKGSHWTTLLDGKMISGGTQKLDPSKKPHEVDSPITEGEGKGLTMRGIYRLRDGRFEFCFDLMGQKRPTSFEPKRGQFAVIIQPAGK